MKQLTCEMCGSTDLIKQDGVFVCQSCGCKYSVEEAKKMMIEGTVSVQGTVKVDNSDAINNYIKMAKNALDSSNIQEAESYANKVIEIDPQNSTAWFIKGKAAGWQTTGADNKMIETFTAWQNAIDYSVPEELDELKEKISNDFIDLFKAAIDLYGGHLASFHGSEEANALIGIVENGLDIIKRLVAKGVSFNMAEFSNVLADKLNDYAVKAYKEAQNEFENYGDVNDYFKTANAVFRIMQIASHYVITERLTETIRSNMEIVSKTVLKYNSTSKDLHKLQIDTVKSLISLSNESLIKSVASDTDEAEKQEAIRQYWESHKNEKTELDNKMSELKCQIQNIDEELSNNSILKRFADKEKEIKELQSKLAGLGIFKGKEKKVLQNEIEAIEKEKEAIKQEKDNIENQAASQKTDINKQIKEIENELNKDRGRVPAKNKYYIENAIANGKINITINQLADVLKNNLPNEVEYKGISEVDNSEAEYDNLAKSAFNIKITEANNPKSQNVGVLLQCYADSLDSPIKAICIDTPNINEKSIKYWIKFAAITIMTLDKDISINTVAANLANYFRGNSNISVPNSLITEKNYKYEMICHEYRLMGIIDMMRKGVLIRNK